MVKVKVYVEGGGDGSGLKTECRKGFRLFLERVGLKGSMPAIIACGSRADAFDSFCTAMKGPKPREIAVLLVDSEAPVKEPPWQHVQKKDNWTKPKDANDDQIHLMVQCMETWIVADRNTLTTYYGQGFQESAMPNAADLETVSPSTLLNKLQLATRNTQKGRYHKDRHSFVLMGLIHADVVTKTCPAAERFVETLKSLVSK